MRALKKQGLERLKVTYKNQGLILPAVQRHVMRKAAAGTDDLERRTDIMHPSEMSKSDWCHRSDFYRMTTGVVQGDANPSFMMENVFDEGHRIHRKWQGWLWSMGILSGMFGCKVCDHTWWDTAPDECPDCGNRRLKYREVPLMNEDLMVAGHSDGVVFDGGDWMDLGEPVLIEVKSLSMGTLRFEAPLLHQRYLDGLGLDEVWRDVKRPFATHIKQGTIYCWLGGFSRIVFIYECKWNQQAKEFVVTPNFDHIADVIAKAEEVANAINTGTVPKRPAWAYDEDGPVCRSCTHRRTCWSIHEEDSKKQEPAPPLVVRATAARRRKALRSTAL